MRISDGSPACLFELTESAKYPVCPAGFAFPYRDGDAPVPLSRNTPVTGFLDPVIKACTPCPFRVPENFFDLVEHPVPYCGCFQEPLFGGTEDDWGFAPPAVSITVGHGLPGKEMMAEIMEDNRICLLDEHPFQSPCFACKTP